MYAEGVDLSAPLPGYPGGFTALHLAIELEDLTSLHIVDFLLGNGSAIYLSLYVWCVDQCMGVWVYGCMGVRVYGCMGVS